MMNQNPKELPVRFFRLPDTEPIRMKKVTSMANREADLPLLLIAYVMIQAAANTA